MRQRVDEPADPDVLVDTATAADLCGVSQTTISMWRARGQLPRPIKMGRRRLNRWADVVAAAHAVQADGRGPRRRYLRELVEAVAA